MPAIFTDHAQPWQTFWTHSEGTDLAKAISGLTQQQFVYPASLAASAKMIRLILLDFLR
jgi:hypothetical protein